MMLQEHTPRPSEGPLVIAGDARAAAARAAALPWAIVRERWFRDPDLPWWRQDAPPDQYTMPARFPLAEIKAMRQVKVGRWG